jgi:hypothetical protein
MRRRSLEIPINQAGLHVEIDLVFREQDLSHIIAYIPHPSTMSMEGSKEPSSCSAQVEAAANLLLWLLGRPHDATVLQRESMKCNLHYSRLYRTPEISRLLKDEEERGKVLDQTDREGS